MSHTDKSLIAMAIVGAIAGAFWSSIFWIWFLSRKNSAKRPTKKKGK